MPQQNKHTDITGRVLGLLTIICGLVLLGLVFWLAVIFFRTPIPGLEQIGVSNAPPVNINLGASLSLFAAKLLVLGLMTMVASLVASHGIRMYFAAVYTSDIVHKKDDAGTK